MDQITTMLSAMLAWASTRARRDEDGSYTLETVILAALLSAAALAAAAIIVAKITSHANAVR